MPELEIEERERIVGDTLYVYEDGVIASYTYIAFKTYIAASNTVTLVLNNGTPSNPTGRVLTYPEDSEFVKSLALTKFNALSKAISNVEKAYRMKMIFAKSHMNKELNNIAKLLESESS